jgi:hypothetical protein
VPGDQFRALVDRAGGARAAARRLGCSHATVLRYCAGQRDVPQSVFEGLQVVPVPIKPGVVPVL